MAVLYLPDLHKNIPELQYTFESNFVICQNFIATWNEKLNSFNRSKIVFTQEFCEELLEIDLKVKELNERKIRLLFEGIGIKLKESDFRALLGWDLILVSIPDRAMAAQLNKIAAYIPNLKFVTDSENFPFALKQGKKGRRVWKER